MTDDAISSELEDGSGDAGDGDALRHRLATQSYVLLRGILPEADVLEVRREILARLGRLGWTAPGTDPQEAVAGPGAKNVADPGYFDAHNALQAIQSLHELAVHPALRAVTEVILGGEVLTHPRRIIRATLPQGPTNVTPPHQDFRHIQGPADVLTTWIPFGTVSPEHGGLKVLVGSARRGVAAPVRTDQPGGLTLDVPDGQWATTTFQPGDVLLFHSFTIHAAMPNRTDRLRLSMDVRHQLAVDPVAPDWIGPDGGPDITGGWEVLTQGWTDTTSIEAPGNLTIVPIEDPFDPALPVPPSRLIRA